MVISLDEVDTLIAEGRVRDALRALEAVTDGVDVWTLPDAERGAILTTAEYLAMATGGARD